MERVSLRGGVDTADLLGAARRVVEVAVGPIAIVGGLAVTCRLRYPHRGTTDVDTVTDDRTPPTLEILGEIDGATTDQRHPDRVYIDGVPVDVISTMPTEGADLSGGIEELFVLAHRFALESAEPVSLSLHGPRGVDAILPIATPAGLVATKLCGVQGLRRRSEAKRATDGYDLHRLLKELDLEGEIARDLLLRGDPLLRCVREAAAKVLVADAARLVRSLEVYGPPSLSATSVDDVTFVGERFVDALTQR